MNTLYDIRLPICQACTQYDKESHTCRQIAARSPVPGKLGKLKHPKGLPDPCTECPSGKFSIVLNPQMKIVLEHIPYIPHKEIKALNRTDLRYTNSFMLARKYFFCIVENDPKKNIKLSRIKKIFDKAKEKPFKWKEDTFKETLSKV